MLLIPMIFAKTNWLKAKIVSGLNRRIKKQKYVVWDDLDGLHKVTVDYAIQFAKLAAEQMSFYYENDEQALQDFLTVHWAWIEEE